jgi:hypothetical protein
MKAFFIITGIASLLSFLVGVATTQWGRGLLLDIGRSLRVPLLGPKMVRLGLYDFFDSRTSLAQKRGSTKIIDYLDLAKKEVGIIAISLNYSVVHQALHVDLRNSIKTNPELQVYIFVLDPDSNALQTVAIATGRSVNELVQYIQQSLSRLRILIQGLDDSEKRRFHLHLYNTYIANTVFVIDPHEPGGRFFVENHLYKTPVNSRYSFECRRADSPMYRKLLSSYEEFKKDFALDATYIKD